MTSALWRCIRLAGLKHTSVIALAPAYSSAPLTNARVASPVQELTAAYDARTLSSMEMHTGFSLAGWDLTETPDYWPAVKQGAEGLEIDC